MQALIGITMKKTWEERLSKIIYGTTVYEKLKVTAIDLYNNNSNNNDNDWIAKEREWEENEGRCSNGGIFFWWPHLKKKQTMIT